MAIKKEETKITMDGLHVRPKKIRSYKHWEEMIQDDGSWRALSAMVKTVTSYQSYELCSQPYDDE